MSRFSSDDYEEMFPNQGELWHANLQRAIKGKHGQRDLRTLEKALLGLPQKRLVRGRLASDAGEVCAVGAYALQRRTEKGEGRESVLSELRSATTVFCERCYHAEGDHSDGRCVGCEARALRFVEQGRDLPYYSQPHHDFEDGYTEDCGDETAQAGKQAGMTYVLAWRIGQLNDEDFGHMTPEARYEAVLAWVRDRIQEPALAAVVKPEESK